MKTVCSYIRVSSKGQVEKDGPERQREAIAKFCFAHKLTLKSESFEKAVSGDTEGMDRPAFRDMLTQIVSLRRNGVNVEAIVVERMDRLARDLMVSEVLLAQCRKNKIKVYAADQEILIDMASDGGDPTRVLIRQIMAALAQWDKTNIVRRLRAARDRKKAETGRCDGKKPYGTLEGEREILDYLLMLYHQTPRLSYRKMETHLFQAGLRNRAGNPWTFASLQSLLARHARRK